MDDKPLKKPVLASWDDPPRLKPRYMEKADKSKG